MQSSYFKKKSSFTWSWTRPLEHGHVVHADRSVGEQAVLRPLALGAGGLEEAWRGGVRVPVTEVLQNARVCSFGSIRYFK